MTTKIVKYKKEAEQALNNANAQIVEAIRSLDFTALDIREKLAMASKHLYEATEWGITRYGRTHTTRHCS